MNVVGLTGGIACGKSTVARLLAERGVAIVDADQIARDVVGKGTDGLREIVDAFGASVLQPDGTLDRAALAKVVFADEARRRALNAFLHPRIARTSAERIQALAAGGANLIVYEATLLVENGTDKSFAGLIVVTARPDVQRARLRERDGLTDAEIDARINAQLSLPAKVAAATWVVDNSGTPAQLASRVADLYVQLVLAYGPPRESA